VSNCAGIRSGKEKEEGEIIKHFLFRVETKMEAKKKKLTLKRSGLSWNPGDVHFPGQGEILIRVLKRGNNGCS
jgi:hypothetical protein